MASFTFRKRSEAKMKLFRRSLVEFMISSLLPCHSFLPSYIYRMFSQMPITEFMSCVLMIVVMLNSTVMS